MASFVRQAIAASIDTPLFGIAVCILFYQLGMYIRKKTGLVLLNPLLTATIGIVVFIRLTHISYERFNTGAAVLQLFLGPITASLAIAVYNQRAILRAHLLPVVAGTIAGSLASMGTVYALCKLLHVEERIMNSMLAKSVTTPIALALSESRGGIVPVTVLSVIITGITGAIFAPYLVKLFRVKDEAAAGIAIGTASHALGTATALEMGEVYGAMSSVAIGCAGLATTIAFVFV
ncbi:MAG: LrgB family protein [Treponema sp.]|nr:LrgB family protein [Treponema sp.]